MRMILEIDGGARGNPGPAASGFVLRSEDKKIIYAGGEFLGFKTNNYAEYTALIIGLKKAQELGASEIVVKADSLLVVEQMNGRWKIKEPTLKQLQLKAKELSLEFQKFSINHVRREENKAADAEVNKILDAENSQ